MGAYGLVPLREITVPLFLWGEDAAYDFTTLRRNAVNIIRAPRELASLGGPGGFFPEATR